MHTKIAKEPAGPLSVIASFLLHVSAAMIIGPVVVLLLGLSAVLFFHNSFGINSVLNKGGIVNPLLWGPGLMLGILANRFTLRRTACWVWLVGIVWIAYGIFAALYSYHARFAGVCSPLDNITTGFFSFVSNYCGGGENVMRFTLPTLGAITYSLGAWIPLRFVHPSELSSGPAKE